MAYTVCHSMLSRALWNWNHVFLLIKVKLCHFGFFHKKKTWWQNVFSIFNNGHLTFERNGDFITWHFLKNMFFCECSISLKRNKTFSTVCLKYPITISHSYNHKARKSIWRRNFFLHRNGNESTLKMHYCEVNIVTVTYSFKVFS